jgi:RNA polymerase sigma factor (sigma-70 family)
MIRTECLREARRLTSPGIEAEDIAQEAAARAWRARRSCRTPGDPLPWLRTITRNEAHRMRSRMSATHELPTAELPEGTGDTSEETTLTRLEIEKALGQLSEADRLMIRLRYEGDLTNPAIASTLGLSVANVKVRLHRLRKSLEESLLSP